MKQSITKSQFIDAFRDHNRQNQFSYSALNALYEYLEDACADHNEYELDVIALCCEYSEYTEEKLKEAYNMDLEELRDNTIVIEVTPLGLNKGETTYLIGEF